MCRGDKGIKKHIKVLHTKLTKVKLRNNHTILKTVAHQIKRESSHFNIKMRNFFSFCSVILNCIAFFLYTCLDTTSPQQAITETNSNVSYARRIKQSWSLICDADLFLLRCRHKKVFYFLLLSEPESYLI